MNIFITIKNTLRFWTPILLGVLFSLEKDKKEK